jgi:predicted nucleic acid-binding protein
VFLVDTDVISEARKGDKGNTGVREFFSNASRNNFALFLSAITVGEFRQGVENIRHRGDSAQAARWSAGLIVSPLIMRMPSFLSIKRRPGFGEDCAPLIRKTRSTNRLQLQH